MKELNELLKERAAKLTRIISKCRKHLKDAPSGSLHAVMTRGHPRYSLRDPKAGIRNRYIKRSEMGLAINLAQRDYYQSVLKTAEEEYSHIDALLTQRELLIAEDCYEMLKQARKVLVTPVTMTDENYAVFWQNKKYEGKGFKEGDPEFYSQRGERMRSKSEVIIANMLYTLGIPYLYECPLTLEDGSVIYPDFTVLNVRTREIFFLEHFGKMGDPEYAATNINRLNALIKNGYYIGVNLLISFESLESPLDTIALQHMIEKFLK